MAALIIGHTLPPLHQYDGSLEVRGEIIRTVLCYIVYCAVVS